MTALAADPRYVVTGRRTEQLRALPAAVLKRLYRRSDAKGLVRLAGHVALALAGGWLCLRGVGQWWQPAALVAQGVVLVALFAPMHEAMHGTAFASRRLNAAVTFLAGVAICYNAAFYRHFHLAHHRFTQDPARDPELVTAPDPGTLGEYLRRISGVDYWRLRATQFWRLSRGRFDGYGFLHPGGHAEIVRSVRLQLAVYAVALAASLVAGSAMLIWSWLLPLVLGMPFLRAYLMAEHGGCETSDDAFANTRTTLANPLIRLIMWNMPFHAEHHLYPNLPFHALPEAHEHLKERLKVVAPSYADTHRRFVAALNRPG